MDNVGFGPSIRLRVENFSVFGITSRMLRNVMEHIDSICSLESGLSFGFICPIGIFAVSEVIM